MVVKGGEGASDDAAAGLGSCSEGGVRWRGRGGAVASTHMLSSLSLLLLYLRASIEGKALTQHHKTRANASHACTYKEPPAAPNDAWCDNGASLPCCEEELEGLLSSPASLKKNLGFEKIRLGAGSGHRRLWVTFV